MMDRQTEGQRGFTNPLHFDINKNIKMVKYTKSERVNTTKLKWQINSIYGSMVL